MVIVIDLLRVEVLRFILSLERVEWQWITLPSFVFVMVDELRRTDTFTLGTIEKDISL